MSELHIRQAIEGDVPAIRDIYNYEVLHGTATFDIEPKSVENRLQWFRKIEPPHCIVVAEEDGAVVGWGCLHPFHERAAYRYTVEDSVYVHHDDQGRGIGTLILSHLIELAREAGFHSIMAGMSEGNEASVRLHQRSGFEVVGVQREVGYKFERWIDVTWMQKMLGEEQGARGK